MPVRRLRVHARRLEYRPICNAVSSVFQIHCNVKFISRLKFNINLYMFYSAKWVVTSEKSGKCA